MAFAPPIVTVLVYAAMPVIGAAIGGGVAALKPPGPRLRSSLQHFAAGVVFSVVAVEMLPDIVQRHLPWEVAIGFAAGVGCMLLLKKLTQRSKSSAGLLVGIGTDFFLDGLLIGIAFSAGHKEGRLLTFALAIELASLGMALASSFMKDGRRPLPTVAMVSGLASLTIVAAALGATGLRAMSSEVMEVTLAFGLAALLFLVTEELLVEAHEEPDTLLGTSMFFGGFLLFLIIGMMS